MTSGEDSSNGNSNSRGYTRDSWLNMNDYGLGGEEGADAVIAEIKRREPFALGILELKRNPFGDAGCARLFEFLCADARYKGSLRAIMLYNTKMGGESLPGITDFLRDNTELYALDLQTNYLKGRADEWAAFTTALNSSRLRRLCLFGNDTLGAAFACALFDALSAPYLEKLELGCAGDISACVPALAAYLRSPRSRALRHLSFDAADLGGYQTVLALASVVENGNFSLTEFPIHEGWSRKGVLPEPEEAAAWVVIRERLGVVEARNKALREDVPRQVVVLLRHARPVLLRYAPPHGTDERPAACFPTEILLHILSFLAPELSTAQQLRVFEYASSPDTLPPASICRVVPGTECEGGTARPDIVKVKAAQLVMLD